MYSIPAHLRSRVSAVGQLSRPLGEARAAALARAIAADLAADVAHGRDPERSLDQWIARIASELTERSRTEPVAGATRKGVRPIGDFLPEIG